MEAQPPVRTVQFGFAGEELAEHAGATSILFAA